MRPLTHVLVGMENSNFKCRAFFLLAMLPFHCLAAEPLVVSPKNQVTYRGTSAGTVQHFQNIRFAHDTSGPRRFGPPVPFAPPHGSEVDASAPGAACPQTPDAMPPAFAETKEMSEDCLNLRIARPSGTTAKSKIPVVVWLHGGGVVKGSAYDPHFEPERIITLSQELDTPVIYVALNYRLTIFGFARTTLLKDQLSLNVGVRDQRVGLQWIKDNIEVFGGDADRITVFGLSAGGTFASLHLMAYGGEQNVPFNQVWAMSGPPGTALNITSTVTESHTKAVAHNVGCKHTEDMELLQCLREVPMDTLLKAAMQYSVANHPPAGLFTFIPSTDDDFFPDRPSVLYKAGRFVKGLSQVANNRSKAKVFAGIPMVLGWTQDDGAMNAGPAQLIQDEAAMKSSISGFASALDDEDFDNLFELYSTTDFHDRVKAYELGKGRDDPVVPVHYFRLSQILRDLLFTCSSIDLGYEMNKQSRDIDPEFTGTRLYVLNQSMLTPLLKGAGMPYVGVCHGSDTNYIFNGLFPEGEISESDQKLSRTMTEAFIRFAWTGNPNSPDSEESEFWPKAFVTNNGPVRGSTHQNPGIQIVGGPLGTGAAHPFHFHERKHLSNDGNNEGSDIKDEAQQILQGYEIGAMQSVVARHRSEVLAQEKLFERCSFINSLSEKLGV
jgi:carboxylesterase type B